jgi:hypothetical protein
MTAKKKARLTSVKKSSVQVTTEKEKDDKSTTKGKKEKVKEITELHKNDRVQSKEGRV